MALAEPVPRRRGTRLSPQQRRRELIEATITVLAGKGHEGFTLADVGREAGVSPSLVLLHFQSKEGLLQEVMVHMARIYFGSLHASQIGPRSAAARLWRLVEAEFAPEYFTDRYLGAWRTFWVALNGRKDYLALFGDETRHFTRLAQDLCAEILDSGAYPQHEARVAGRLIDAALGGLWIELTHGPEPLSIDEARHIARAMLVMLFPRHFSPTGPVDEAG